MLALQLACNGIVTGCALGIVAVSFSLVYATTKIFHVAHAGIYTMGGYLAWSLVSHGAPAIVALAGAVAGCTVGGALIQSLLYARLERRRATHLVVLIASLGVLAVMQNVLAAVYTPNILLFPVPWGSRVLSLGGNVRLTWTQLATVAVSLLAYTGVMWFAHRTILGKRIRAVASNPFLAEITRLQPRSVYIYVVAIASAIVCLPGVLVPLDLGLQPYNGVTPLLTATIAMIAGGVGSITGAFVLSVAIAELQNLSLLVIPGEWSIGVTFFIFVIFMLFRPTGLFAAARLVMDFWFSYITLASIYVLLGLSTNLLVGIAGIFSVSQAAVFGVGAYIVAFFLMNDVMGFLPALLIAAICCVALNILVTLPALRVSGDYFVVTSFGIQLLATAVFTNWTAGTGGANGLPGIPPPDLFGKALENTSDLVVLCVAGMGLGCLAFWLIMRAPFGRLVRAIREDELAVAAAGKNVLRVKVSAAALAGAFAGTAGGLYATFLSFIDPSSFDLDSSILLLTMVVVGGARTLAGSIIGPFLLLALPQILTLIDIPTTIAAAARQLMYGVLLIAFMLFRPQGIAGEKL